MTGQSKDWSTVMDASRVYENMYPFVYVSIYVLVLLSSKKVLCQVNIPLIVFSFLKYFLYMTFFFIFLTVFQREVFKRLKEHSFKFDKPSLFIFL